MLRNCFKTAFRSLIRNRNYTIINIAGLAVGIAVCLIIFIVIQFQTSFDNFHTKKDRIYRVLTEYNHAEAANTGKDVPHELIEEIVDRVRRQPPSIDNFNLRAFLRGFVKFFSIG